MSIRSSVIKHIDAVIDARNKEIANLRKQKEQIKKGNYKYRADLFGLYGEHHHSLQCDNKSLKKAIWNVLGWYHDVSLGEWPPKAKGRGLDIRLHVHIIPDGTKQSDPYFTSTRVFDEKHWWHHVASCVEKLRKTKP